MPPPPQGARRFMYALPRPPQGTRLLTLLVLRGNEYWELPDFPEPQMLKFEVVPDPEFETAPDAHESNLQQWEWKPGVILDF